MEKKKTHSTCTVPGPWSVCTNGTEVFVCYDDFTYYVALDIRGDFADYSSKRRYAHFICEALNEKAEKIGLTLDSLEIYENS